MKRAEVKDVDVGLTTKVFYGVGAVAFGVKDNGFGYFLLLFYNQVVGLPASLVGAALMIALFADAVVDLFIGQASDNFRSRLGRRHPFMYASAIPVAVAYALLWNPPALSQGALFAYLLVVTILVRALIAAYEIPSNALVPELTRDYAERTKFFSFRFFFSWWGGLAMTLLALEFLLRPGIAHQAAQLNRAGYGRYGIVAGVVMLISILISSLGTHRNIKQLRPPPPSQPFEFRRVIAEIGGSLSNRSFLMILLAAITGSLATGLIGGLQFYMTTYFWQLSTSSQAVLVLGSFGGSLAGVIVAPPLSRRVGKRNSAIGLAILSVIVNFAPIILRLMGLFPVNGSPLLVPLLFSSNVASIFLGVAANVLISSMLTDVVEDSELSTGRRSEGLFLAASSFVAKSTTGLGIFASGLIISVVHFPQHAQPGMVSPVILRNFVLLYLPVTGLLYALGLVFLARYQISRASHATTLTLLDERAARSAIEAAAE